MANVDVDLKYVYFEIQWKTAKLHQKIQITKN